MIDWEKELTEFLKKHEAYDKFVHNLNTLSQRPDKDRLTSIYGKTESVGAGFVWSESSEGLTYWSEISDKWEQHCISLKQDTSPESK